MKPQSLQLSDLLPSVGTSGAYQATITALCCFLILQNGMVFLSSAYNFAVTPYTQCPSPHQGIPLCTQYACSLPPEQRLKYLNSQIAQLTTLGNQFGNYHCHQQYLMSIAMGSLWVGALIGAVSLSTFADNFGRRKALLLSQLLGVIGMIVTLLAPNLLVASIGMLVEGASRIACSTLVYTFLQEILTNQDRQKRQILVQVFYSLGALLLIFLYYTLKDWKPIFLWGSLLPQTICLVFSYFYWQQTPQFLVKLDSPEKIRSSLQFMARQNGLEEDFIRNELMTVQMIRDLKERHEWELSNQTFTFLTFFEYPSLRVKTLCVLALWFSISFLYFLPFLLVSQFGFNFFLNGVVLNAAELLTYFLTYSTVTRLPRKPLFLTAGTLILVSAFALIFINQNRMCSSNCWGWQQIAELVLFGVVMFSGALLVQLIVVYMCELYPVQVVALSMGLGECATCASNIFLPSLLLLLNLLNLSIMVLFCLVAGVFLVALLPLPQTLGVEPAAVIEELETIEGDCEQL